MPKRSNHDSSDGTGSVNFEGGRCHGTDRDPYHHHSYFSPTTDPDSTNRDPIAASSCSLPSFRFPSELPGPVLFTLADSEAV